MMKFDDSGRTRSVAIAALLLATVAVAVVAGFALGAMDSGSDERTGEEVLSDVQETYADAESVSDELDDARIIGRVESGSGVSIRGLEL
jgi:outer membrane lipoprotein-sorting protein